MATKKKKPKPSFKLTTEKYQHLLDELERLADEAMELRGLVRELYGATGAGIADGVVD